jgi:energy-converting hydrogenase A subunit R
MKTKEVSCWDLEGPITILDFAADLSKKLTYKSKLDLKRYDMRSFYGMLSKYDDYLIETPGVKKELNIPNYEPGDTLRLIAPLYIFSFSDNELKKLAEQNLGLLPGCKELMKNLHKDWDIYIISTSYCHFANTIAKALKIAPDRVFCTKLNVKNFTKSFQNISNDVDLLIRNIFKRFMNNGQFLSEVVNDLNDFFWKHDKTNYIEVMNKIQVRGGKRKEIAVEEISNQTGVPISEMVVLGDSITDINMLQRVKREDGIAVSFNGNRFTVNRSNIAITTQNNLGTLPIFRYKKNIEEFLENWEDQYESFKDNPRKIPESLVSRDIKELFIKHRFVPEIENLKNKSKNEIDSIITKQEKWRKIVRGWAGNLG